MNISEAVITALENSPSILLPLAREIKADFVKRRPSPEKWSAHEHACHLAEVHPLFMGRLELMLTADNPKIVPYFPDVHDAPDALLNADLEESLARFVTDRQTLVEKLKSLSSAQWQRTANHEEYAHYSIFIMFRHLALHDFLHTYRIEELLLKRDWK